MFDVDLNLDELRASVSRFFGALEDHVPRAVTAAVNEGAAEAVAVHQYKDRSGALTRTIRGTMLFATRGAAEGEITAGGADAPYAEFVEGGTKPHEIRPKEGHGFIGPLLPGQSRRDKTDIGTHRVALRWKGSDGLTHFASVVHHPGSKAYPFMGPAYLKAERVLEREMGNGLDAAQRAFGE